MNKNTLGILGLFILIFGITWWSNENFTNGYNMTNLVKWSSLYAIMGIGVAFVIITGGIDLSIGSVIGLVAALMALAINSANLEVAIDYKDGQSKLRGWILHIINPIKQKKNNKNTKKKRTQKT